ncbi:MAG TPA: carbonic anhydrase [Gaiellaceae bacterium]|nr:carbonic anhydrase [Gaiellaceae bacterium]
MPEDALPRDLREANNRYAAAWGERGALARKPARRLAILTCMDARVDPARALGLVEGDAHVIRNAGGVASDDALRSLVISNRLLGTETAYVVGHTQCGMISFTNEELYVQLEQEGIDGRWLDFLPFKEIETSVVMSVRKLRTTPLLPVDYRVEGFVFDVATGRLEAVDVA